MSSLQETREQQTSPRVRIMPRYPIYLPTKGRYDVCYTAQFLTRDRVPFTLVVNDYEEAAYRKNFPDAAILVLPERDQGLIYARNWIKRRSIENGDVRHWQLDDNIKGTRRWFRGKRLACVSNIAFRVVEDISDRYENVAISGPNYTMFAHQGGKQPKDPFWLNVHVYSASLILNEVPCWWRLRYNDDTDMCLQVLAAGWCTISVNAFMVDKMRTMVVKGGNTADLYQGDGRLKMARSLERVWPGVVTVNRRFQRPQHMIKNAWKGFDTPLILKSGITLAELPADEYGLKLTAVREIKSASLRDLVSDAIINNE